MRQDPSHACPSERLLRMIRAVFTCHHQPRRRKRERAMMRKTGQKDVRPRAWQTRCYRLCLLNACGGNVALCHATNIAILSANRYCMSEVLFNKAKAEAPKTVTYFAGIFFYKRSGKTRLSENKPWNLWERIASFHNKLLREYNTRVLRQE